MDKATGEKIKEEIIKGHEGEKYETKAKEIDGYILVETPKNAKGEMAKEEIIVIYYYQRKAQVEVKYIDKDTGYEIEEKQIIEGYVGKDYLTEEKDIKYYDLASKEGQTQGTMTKDKITVIYYYEKEIFNLSIETLIDKVSVDGIWQIAQGQNDKMYQININRNKANKTEVEVTYKIKITNKGELAGRATKIGQSIPKGFIYRQEDNKIKWVQENGILVTDAIKEENIEPGQSKEIELVLRWAKGEENFGEKETLSSIIGTENLAGYKDVEQEDNISKTKMLITIATGLDSRDKMIMVSIQIVQLVILITIGLILIIKKVKKTNE